MADDTASYLTMISDKNLINSTLSLQHDRQLLRRESYRMALVMKQPVINQPATWDELYSFIHTALCERENLIEEQFKTHVQPVYREHKICAVEFELHALRNVRLAAVWALDKNELFFYDARGERFQKLKLNHWINYQPERINCEKISA